jgi:abequosyltransferase
MRLSICIPTYNRAEYLPMLLDSISAQTGYGCELEVVISDNASTDDTSAIARHYRKRFARFVYHRADTNQGADRNFLKVVGIASGDFCWLMGSDDILEPGSVAAIERVLDEQPDAAGILVRNNSYDIDMRHRISIEGSGGAFNRTTVLEGTETVFAAIGAHFGYISANIVNRKIWQQAVEKSPVSDYFNAWVHVYVIGRMLTIRPKWIYLAEACVGWRCGNDSFLSEGMFKRLQIDLVGYEEVVTALYGVNSAIRRDTLRRILPHARHRVLHSKVQGISADFFHKTFALLFRYYRTSPRFWITCAPVFLLPASAVRVASRMRRSGKRLLGSSPAA